MMSLKQQALNLYNSRLLPKPEDDAMWTAFVHECRCVGKFGVLHLSAYWEQIPARQIKRNIRDFYAMAVDWPMVGYGAAGALCRLDTAFIREHCIPLMRESRPLPLNIDEGLNKFHLDCILYERVDIVLYRDFVKAGMDSDNEEIQLSASETISEWATEQR